MSTVASVQLAARALAFELRHGQDQLAPDLKTAVAQAGPLDQAELTGALVDQVERAERGAHAFVSTPITGGPRLLAYLEKTGIHQLEHGLPVMTPEQRDLYFKDVVIPNRRHADEITQALESRGILALESARTERIPNWTNDKYNQHWMGFVGQLPSLAQVVVCDGWQYSFGTLLEMRSAMDRGVQVDDERGRPITRQRAQSEVTAAVADAGRHGFDFSKLAVVMSEPNPQNLPMSL